MKLCVIGSGYVGLVVGTCFAETGNDVICMDVDEKKIAQLEQGKVPIYEPGLEELLRRNAEEGRLQFTTDLKGAVENSLIIFIAVGTPPNEDGSSDLRHVLEVARGIAASMNGYKIIVNKSTVPVGTADRVRREMEQLTRFQFDVVSNPEFLKEGAAIDDFMKPDRVIIGVEEVRVAEIMKELYGPFTRKGPRVLVMDTRSAEMTKYAANAMLAARISFMNEVANLCEHVGADIHWVRQGIGTDRRIGPSFLFPGVGYGGSCFPKDIKALISVAREHNYPLKLVQAIEDVNELQKGLIVEKILKFYASDLADQLDQLKVQVPAPELSAVAEDPPQARAVSDVDYTYQLALDEKKIPNMAFVADNQTLHSSGGTSDLSQVSPVRGKTFAVWGLAFKPQTDDMREAPSRTIIERLLDLGAQIRAYDPAAASQASRLFGPGVTFARTNYEALKGADALILITEWNAFRNPDFQRIKTLLRYPVIFDGRNQYNPQEMRALGILYFGIGRK